MKTNNVLTGLVIVVMAFWIGSYAMLGMLQLIALVALVESVQPLRWFFERSANIIDIILFLLGIVATANVASTVASGLIFAGIGFTLVYKPYIKVRYQANKKVKSKRHFRF